MSDDVVRRQVTVNGSRISYLSLDREPEAAQPVILLIHGSGVNARCWIEQIRGLHAARVLAIDLPGHGESDDVGAASIEHHAEVAAAFLDTLGAAPVIAVGHSLGGAVALSLAARHPAAVEGLVLLSTCARLPSGSVAAHWMLPFLPRPMRKAMFFTTAEALLFAPSAPRRAVGLGMHELCACRPETLAKDVAMSRSMDFTGAAKALRVPALVLCGSRDQITPPALSAHLHRLIAGSRLSIVEGAGHMVLIEAPDIVNGHIHAFADAVIAARRAPRLEPAAGRHDHAGSTDGSARRCTSRAAARPRRWCRRFRHWVARLPIRYAASRRPALTHPRSSRVCAVVHLASPLPLTSRRRLGMQGVTADDGGWWSEIDEDVLACLRDGPKSTTELGERLRLSPAALSSVLLMLAAEGRVRVDSVDLA